MAHKITQGPRRDIVFMDIYQELEFDDMTASRELGLDSGRKLYVMLDLTKMNVGLPVGFLEGAKKSFFLHDNLVHLSIHVQSDVLKIVANMVAKLTRNPDKLSLHSTREAAIAYLESLPEQASV
jgi:hypothetical protein